MAETLTYDAGTDTVTTEENLNAEEQDSLQVGEAMQEEQEQLLAGKYKNAQELESAYVELQKKLGGEGNKDSESAGEPSDSANTEETSEETKETKEDTEQTNILDSLWKEANSGEKFSDETLKELNGMKPGDLASLHLEYRKANAPKELTEQDVTELKNLAGGDQGYTDMLQWAEKNLNPQEINMFDQVMEKGDPLAAFFAVRALSYRFEDARGVEGRMVTGNTPKTSGNTFRSQAEVVKAMSDSRYENDPAYRQDIMQKLERSDINF